MTVQNQCSSLFWLQHQKVDSYARCLSLLQRELPSPRQISYMSKSFGNFVDPMLEAKSLTVDGVRYFLLRQGVPQSDNNYASSLVRQVLNDELANCIGNLLSRSTAADINPSQRYPAFDKALFDDQFLARVVRWNVVSLVDVVTYSSSLEAIMTVMRGANSFFQKHEPWKNTRDEKTTLHVTYQALRLCGILLQPIIPDHAERLLDRLGIPLEDRCFNKCPRILGHFFERLQM
ncbi:unnamed protein product [Soboliphyme baturini]|uniref:Methionine--tRNA ligase, mitochondrial n=1 Tax=Soboliphyme baturini TaxID=241478 RepID=A0A183J3T5_9BILA|nr:unnamed protein product [Soboliphyme baturini]